jgi:DNA-binding transcriptional regulator YiaG
MFDNCLYIMDEFEHCSRMSRPIQKLNVNERQAGELETLINKPTQSQRMARRCKIILLRSRGLSQQQTADALGINRPVVSLWENRFKACGKGSVAGASPP